MPLKGSRILTVPTRSTILKVFVASPSDLAEERQALEQVIAEVNQIRSSTSGVRLELVRWETHARPGFGADAQDVINSQLPDDFDIFLGLMWARFGSPTNRAESGTQEEFTRAFQRFQSAPKAVSLLLYFKEAPVDFDQIDPDQFKQVRDFKAAVQANGGLYWTFRSLDELQGLLRVHLQAEITEWEKRLSVSGADDRRQVEEPPESGGAALLIDDDEEDLGFLDYLDTSNEKFAEATVTIDRIGTALSFMSERINERADQMKAISAAGDYDVKAAKRVAKRTAEDMQQFIAQAVVDTPLMANAMVEAIRSFGNATAFALDYGAGACDGLSKSVQAVAQMSENMQQSREGLLRMRASVATLPRIQKDFNAAKRNMLVALDQLLAELQSGQNLARSVEESIRGVMTELGCDAGGA